MLCHTFFLMYFSYYIFVFSVLTDVFFLSVSLSDATKGCFLHSARCIPADGGGVEL